MVAVGAACIIAAWYYTGGKRPYGYAGLGELFVFVFFGLVATRGTSYVQLLRVPESSVWAGVGTGALSCAEVEADDAPAGKLTSFPQSVDLKPGETVFAGIVTYRSRAHRDEVNARMKKDPRMAGMDPKTMPFDAMRMFFGGFKPFVGDLGAAARVQPYLFFRGRCAEAID